MRRKWHPDDQPLFYGLIVMILLATLLVPFCMLSGCDFYFGSKIVHVLNLGDDRQDGE